MCCCISGRRVGVKHGNCGRLNSDALGVTGTAPVWSANLAINGQVSARSGSISISQSDYTMTIQLGSDKPMVNWRNLSGRGIGMRVDYLAWYLDTTVAWRNQGGEATADSLHRNPRYWVMANYRF